MDKATSDSNGSVISNNVLYGTYVIKETKAPVGYNISSDILTVNINEEGKTVQATTTPMVNKKIKGTIEFYKTLEGGEPLENAEFALYDPLDTAFLNPLMKAVSDSSGLVKFDNVLYGKYSIKETKAPVGYTLSSTILSAEISEEGKTVKTTPETIIDTKIRGTIAINKIDNDGNAVAGVEFAVYDEADTKYEKPLMIAVRDADGKLVFKDLAYGKYVVKEIKAPVGYQLSKDTLEIFVKDHGIIYSQDVRDAKILVSVIVKAVDNDGKSLPNTEFMIYDNSGKPIGTVKSDEQGIVKFDNVRYGDYTIKQIKSDNGYTISDKTITVKVDSPESRNLIVENQKAVPQSKDTNPKIDDKSTTGDSTKTDKITTDEATIEGLPKTGAYFNFASLLMIGVINVLIGTIFIVRRRN